MERHPAADPLTFEHPGLDQPVVDLLDPVDVHPDELRDLERQDAGVQRYHDLGFGLGEVDDPGRIIVCEPSVAGDQPAGWLVGTVERVVRVDPDDVDAPPEDDPAVRGLLQNEDGYLVWVDPRAVHAE